MFLIALTGGIASGKSLVSERLAQLGAVIVDADVLAREVVEPGTPALAEIAREFGPDMLRADGSLDREALGSAIFRDPELRLKLNGITHPRIWQRAQDLIAEARQKNPRSVVVYDVPLLAEAKTGRDQNFDLVVVVHADTATRLHRLMHLRGLQHDEAQHRLNSQATDTERLAIADLVIDNNGSIADTLAQVDRLWERASRTT